MRVAIAAAVGFVLAFQLFGARASAQATLSWSAPIAIDEAGSPGVTDVACPSASQCTAVDGKGREVTYDPGAPGSPTPVAILPGVGQSWIACPSVLQCTAIGGSPESNGLEVTFDPRSPPGATSAPIPEDGLFTGIACPSTGECTAVFQELFGCRSDEVTFNPHLPGGAQAVVIDQVSPCPIVGHFALGPSLAVACPSASQCAVVDSAGRETTFDPVSPGSPTPMTIDSGKDLAAVDCVSTSQCTAIDDAGGQVTFNPISPARMTLVTIDKGHQLNDLACPIATMCVAVDDASEAVEGEPALGGSWKVERIAGADQLSSVDCPTVWRCVAVDLVGHTFVGMPPPRLTQVRQSHGLWREPSRLEPRRTSGSAPLGTTFSFVLNEQAQVTFTFSKRLPGRMVGHRCVAMTAHNRVHPRCTRRIVSGRKSEKGRQGHNRVPFSGRLSLSRRLTPGHYTVLIAAVNVPGQRSRQHSLTFTIVP
jgi:hypothetical protein